ncbi:MAG: exopolysaccharide biosynthesis polyprenyl glycosylphosphotransferase, partial [Saprospiraceae bacterium]|nr:exopolysaccharide biosynthesis polyprenyl glycosylphosphotransferase [Saprospiraceae bacterium]
VGGTPSQLRYIKKIYSNTYGPNTFCVGRFGPTNIKGIRKLGNYQKIATYLSQNADKISKLIYLHSELSQEEIQNLVQICRANFIEFEVVPMEVHFFSKGVQVEQLAHLPIMGRKKEPLRIVKNQVLKRAFDIIVSLGVILLIFPWLFAIIAIIIKLESKGPVFFLQDRSGYWSKPFKLIKFRTMRINSACNKKQAVRGDSRITRFGSLLRRTSMDELPQFFNVFKGDMSIVGPRPHMLRHTEDYAKLISSFMIRHEVKPGITGWAQVSGWRGPTDEVYKMAKRVEYDMDYIEGWNFWFDCKCIIMTITNAIKGEANAF